ncbi:MAG: metallophosphoesterase [Pseudomonadota bacterium]
MRIPRPLFVAPFWVAAAGCLALPILDASLGWADAMPKRVLLAAVCAALLAASLWGARYLTNGPLRWLPFALLLLALENETAQGWARHRHAASAPLRSTGATPSLLRPTTTTDLVIHYYELRSAALNVPRLRVVEASDLHVSPQLPQAYFEHVLAEIAEQEPDVIVLTGDYVSFPENMRLLAQLLPGHLHAPLGVYAVLGNHDYWTDAEGVRQILRSAGVTVLSGACTRLPASAGRIAVCGTEAPWGPKLGFPLAQGDLSLVLSHTPDNIYDLSALGASVVFSGHLHGGQIRLPGLGALVVPSRYGRRFDEGHFRVAETDLFVSTGIGADDPPLRLYCPPDLLVVDFMRERE